MWKQVTGSALCIKFRLKKPDLRTLCYGLLAAAALVLWIAAGMFWLRAGDYKQQVSLRYDWGILTGEQLDTYWKSIGEKEEPGPQRLTAWKLLSNQQFGSTEINRQLQGNVAVVYGSMEDVLLLPLLSGGFGNKEDDLGCVISSQAASELFGSIQVEGLSINYQESMYQVRGVVESKEVFLAVYGDSKESMNYLEMRLDTDVDSPKAESVKQALGLPDANYTGDGDFYHSVLRLCMLLPFWAGYLWLFRWFWRRKSRLSVILTSVLGLLFVIILGAGLAASFSFGPDFIPSRWSDFSFWNRKIQEILANEVAGGAYGALYPQAAMKDCLLWGILCAVGSAALVWKGCKRIITSIIIRKTHIC